MSDDAFLSRRSFNKLLITLATADSLLIVVFILEKAVVDVFIMSSGGEEPLW